MSLGFLKKDKEESSRQVNKNKHNPSSVKQPLNAANSEFMTGSIERERAEEGAGPHKYRVTYNRKFCVGGDICTFIDPDHFVLNTKDGKADFKGAELAGKGRDEGRFAMEIEDPTMNDIGNPVRRAADSCPAGVIRVIRVKDGRLVAGH